MNKKSIIFMLAVSLYLISCGKAEDIISPTHYSRVPRPVNLTANYDTTSTGKYRVNINWTVNNTNNLKDFEIYRSINDGTFFFLSGGIIFTKFIDSTLSNANDYSLSYFVNGRGIDRFVGQSSDTIKITVTKTF